MEWREAGPAGGERWKELHEHRRRVVRALRRAGYVSRWRWRRERTGERQHGAHTAPSWTYTDGPAAGCEAVDPWKVARKVSLCCSSFPVSLRARAGAGGLELAALAIPSRCGLGSVCPVCGATGASVRAHALRAVISELQAERPRGVALGTFTQRDLEGEPLGAAGDRFKDGWRRMTTGRPGRRLRELVEGWYYGDEAPRSWSGKHKGAPRPDSEDLERWHYHRHVVFVLRPGVSHERARAEIGQLWRDSSEAAAQAAGLEGYGWDPHAGGCVLSSSGEVSSWAGRWWEVVPADDDQALYQACKYPSPTADLRPVALAEWVAAAFGRRWHHGAGVLRGVMKRAAELEADGAMVGDDDGDPRPDMGENLVSLAPGRAPVLEHIDPRQGIDPVLEAPANPEHRCTWTLSASGRRSEIFALVAELGGRSWVVPDPAVEPDDREIRVALPRGWVVEATRSSTAALADHRRRQRERRLMLELAQGCRAPPG